MAFAEGNDIRWPLGSGEMASRIRRYPWHQSALGSAARWPPHLRAATDLMLGAAVPTLILSGSDGVALYNDAFVPFLGSLHPGLLGSALSAAGANDGARFRTLALAVDEGETIVTEDNWLGLPRGSEEMALTRLACSPLRSAKGSVSGIWVQMLTATRPPPAATTSDTSWPASLTARYEAALDIDTVGIAFFRPDGVVTEANDTYCKMHGIDKMDVLAGHIRWGDGTANEWLTLLRRSMDEYQVSGRVLPHEKECIRPDGHRWWGMFSAKQLSATEGVEYVIDISTRMLAEQDLKDSERRARTLMEGIPQIVWRATGCGHWTWTSPQWTELTGQPQNQACGLGWLERVHPEDREEAHSIWDRASGQQEFEANYRLWHIGENRHRAFKTRATPVRDEGGKIVEWLGTSTDIEDLQQLQGRLQVMVAELQHRTRNLLALVRSIAAQTIAHRSEVHGDIKEQYSTFSERLAALSRAQSLITRTRTERVDLEGLLRSELAAMRSGEGVLVELLGPKVALSPTHAQALALVTHELATNALKYGALGTPGGELHITWTAQRSTERDVMLHLVWRERGVDIPPGREHRRGFGRELIEEALQFSLDARTDLRFCPDGVACSIELPLSNVHTAVAV